MALGRLRGLWKITRPLNCALVFGCVLLAGPLNGNLSSMRLWLAAAVAALLCAAGNVINDCFDLRSDAIDKPFRPLVTGEIGVSSAWSMAAVLMLCGLGLSAFLGAEMALVALLLAALAYAYSLKLKKIFLVGNIVIAAMSAFTVVYGGLALETTSASLAPAAVIFVFTLCREILKTSEDIKGDRMVGAKTIAVTLSRETAVRWFCILIVAVLPITFLPWLSGDVSTVYVYLLVPTVNAILVASALRLYMRPQLRNIRAALAATKIASLIWVTAMFIGAS